MNLCRWLREHSLRLLAIRDTPDAIAGGVALGMSFGSTPPIGLKTVCTILFAWLTRSNIIAVATAGTTHDVELPFMPVRYRVEYKLGYWLLNHQWPEEWSKGHLSWHELGSWTTFLTVGKPQLLGSVVCGASVALVSFVVTRILVARHQ